jgi:hypothetical protein
MQGIYASSIILEAYRKNRVQVKLKPTHGFYPYSPLMKKTSLKNNKTENLELTLHCIYCGGIAELTGR